MKPVGSITGIQMNHKKAITKGSPLRFAAGEGSLYV